MNVRLKFSGLPILYKAFNKKEGEIEIDFSGKTLRELIAKLTGKYGAPIQEALLDRNGDVALEIKVALNNTTYLTEGRMDAILNDGDNLDFTVVGC